MVLVLVAVPTLLRRCWQRRLARLQVQRVGRQMQRQLGRVFYEHSLRRLARAFPDLQVPVTQLVAGLHARERIAW